MNDDNFEAIRQAETTVALSAILIELETCLQDTINPLLNGMYSGVTKQLNELHDRVARLEQAID